MPRATHGDRFTISLLFNGANTTFDLTSKIMDFKLLLKSDTQAQYLLILAEEEIVVLDLTRDNWPLVPLPYLNSIHSSSVTCLSHISDINPEIFQRICNVGDEVLNLIY